MAYSTPSPSDSCSNWSSSFSDSDASTTSVSTVWNGRDLDLPATPPMPYAALSNVHKYSVTSAPKTATSSPTSSFTSSASNTSPTVPRGRRLPKDESDWARHRERISFLYKTKRLKDVMHIMETEHNFVATERMYKAQFNKWALGKNVTASKVLKLWQKVEQHQKHMNQQAQHGQLSEDACKTTVLDVGDDLDVKQIQKYMKRKPVGLKKLRADPKRPLDVIRALSVDTSKGRSGRTKVSVPTVKLEQQQLPPQFHVLTSPPSDLMFPWSPEPRVTDSLPVDMTRLLQTVVDQDFNAPYPHTCSPLPVSPAPSYQWQSANSQSLGSPVSSPIGDALCQDELMLHFVLKFRIAHILLDDGFTAQAMDLVNVCLTLLSARLQQTQGTDSRATCTALLYALSAALEMAVCFHHLDVLHMLLQHINMVCAGQQPRMAEMARLLPQLGRTQQISTLKLARQMMSRAALGYPGHENPEYDMYSRTVDIAIRHSPAEEKLRALQALSAEPSVQEMPVGALWMGARVAVAVGDAPWAAQQQGLWTGNSLWKYSQENKTTLLFRYISHRIDCHKVAGNWALAEKWATEVAWTAEIALGYDHEVTRKFRDDAEGVKSPMLGQEDEAATVPVSVSVAQSLPSMDALSMGLPLRDMGFKQEGNDPLSSPGWGQTQGQFPDTTLPSLWNIADGVMDGGVGLYDVGPF